MSGGSRVAPVLVARGWGGALQRALRCALSLLALVVIIQALVVVEARPQELMTGIRGMADFIRRAMPPDFSRLPSALWPTLQTIDIALFGTLLGTILATPLAVLRRRLSRYMLVERFFAWIQWQRRILVRWEFHAQNFLGFVQLACLVVLFRRF